MERISFGIIGGGWRAEFFLRIAATLPGRFHVGGMMVRDPGKGQGLGSTWGVGTYRTLDEFLAVPDLGFVVVSVPRAVCPVMLRALAERRIPALAETPPAPDLPGLLAACELARQGARIQVAEQYPFQPLHAARLKIAQSGLLGTISQAQVSAAHGYHGISLMRLFLGAGFAAPTITARRFTSPIVAGPGRSGPPACDQISESAQVIAQFDFGDRLGVLDFAGDQYFSWVRSPRLLVRGERGEINNSEVRYLRDYLHPVELELRRVNAGENGNLEGYHLKGILAGDRWLYENAYAPGRLSDDEIAVATCLERMAAYVAGGPACYSVAEAAQDHYLSLLMDEAVQTGGPVTAQRQPWAGAAAAVHG